MHLHLLAFDYETVAFLEDRTGLPAKINVVLRHQRRDKIDIPVRVHIVTKNEDVSALAQAREHVFGKDIGDDPDRARIAPDVIAASHVAYTGMTVVLVTV